MKSNKNTVRVRGVLTTKNKKISVNLFVIQFEDDGSQVVYCPALNVYGYGETEADAQRSFEICLEGFFDYTTTKKTLAKELESLGWAVKKEKKFIPPVFSKLLESNRDLKKIMDSRDFKKVNEPFTFPAFA